MSLPPRPDGASRDEAPAGAHGPPGEAPHPRVGAPRHTPSTSHDPPRLKPARSPAAVAVAAAAGQRRVLAAAFDVGDGGPRAVVEGPGKGILFHAPGVAEFSHPATEGLLPGLD